jgi:hypothetical protein
MREYLVYWYHLAEHTDPLSQGYVGVTCQNDVRKRCHINGSTGGSKVLHQAFKKYGVGAIIQDILCTTTDAETAYTLEQHYRPLPRIGWNLAAGGGLPPDTTGRVDSPEVRKKRGLSVQKARLTKVFPNKFKGTTGRYSQAERDNIGSYHRGKTISEAHRKAITEKISGGDSPKAKEIYLVHVDFPEVVYCYPCIKVAADTHGIPYNTLRSQAQRTLKNNTPSESSRTGWMCLTKDTASEPVKAVQMMKDARIARWTRIVAERKHKRLVEGAGVTPSINR